MSDEWSEHWVEEQEADEDWVEEPSPRWLKQCWKASDRARVEGRDESSQPPMGWGLPGDEEIEAFCDVLLNDRAGGGTEVTPMISPLRNTRGPDLVQNHLDSILWAQEKFTKERGGRGQPPMVERLRFVLILVRALEARGIPFGVSLNSSMNKLVRKALNKVAEQWPDERKSRRKKITAGAVRALLREVRYMRKLVAYEFPILDSHNRCWKYVTSDVGGKNTTVGYLVPVDVDIVKRLNELRTISDHTKALQ